MLTISGTSGGLVSSALVNMIMKPQPPPDFTLGAAPNTVTVNAGNSASCTATVTAVNGFSGGVSLSVSSGLPTGATASFSPASVTGSGSSTLTVATGTAAPGTYTLTISGTSGSMAHTASVTLMINIPDFTLSASPTSQPVTVGNSASYSVNVGAVNGFSGSVALAATGLPPGR